MERRERKNDVYAVIKISYKFLGRVRQSCVHLVPTEFDFSPLLGLLDSQRHLQISAFKLYGYFQNPTN